MDFLKKYWLPLLVLLLALWAISGINAIPRMDENVNAAWAQVQNQYQRRSDLVPNLVATVKGYAAHEHGTLEDVVKARAEATKATINITSPNDAEALKRYEDAQGALTQALSRLMAISENYPDLKANQNFLALQSQLEGTENRISVARRDYIQAVQQYNTYIRTFPGVLWAKFSGAKPKPSFTAGAGAEKAPQVSF